MFEPNMDEYLDEEVESVKQAFEVINRDWERKVSQFDPPSSSLILSHRYLRKQLGQEAGRVLRPRDSSGHITLLR